MRNRFYTQEFGMEFQDFDSKVFVADLIANTEGDLQFTEEEQEQLIQALKDRQQAAFKTPGDGEEPPCEGEDPNVIGGGDQDDEHPGETPKHDYDEPTEN